MVIGHQRQACFQVCLQRFLSDIQVEMSWRELDVMESREGVRGWGHRSGAISDAQALWQSDGGDACVGDMSVNREEA
jgi:hypothetical protein